MEAKETYTHTKTCVERPFDSVGGKRDLLWRQKRPTMEAKETYYKPVLRGL
jgi:hypothetical protein